MKKKETKQLLKVESTDSRFVANIYEDNNIVKSEYIGDWKNSKREG